MNEPSLTGIIVKVILVAIGGWWFVWRGNEQT